MVRGGMYVHTICAPILQLNMAFGRLTTVIRNLVCSVNVLTSYRNARNYIQYTHIKQTCDEFVKYWSSNGSFTDMTPRTPSLSTSYKRM